MGQMEVAAGSDPHGDATHLLPWRSAPGQEGSAAAARSVVPRTERAHFACRSVVLGAQATFDDDIWWA